jgi:vacuolar-type H+-ATPase subunit I/STV1
VSKPVIGIIAGAVLGLLDGVSAWFSPEARPIIISIIAGSTIKGVVTGLIAGLIANRRQSVAVGIIAGLLIGFVLSAIVAIAQGDHYLEIILPGMLVGALTGFVTQRYSPTRVRAAMVLALVSIGSIGLIAQQAPQDNLAVLAPLIGKWTGTSEGQPGNGTVERDYERVLRSRFIRGRNRSTYPPQEKNPKGEIHEDEGLFSFDRARKQIVFRQFHVEGFVTTYVQDAEAKPGTVSLTTESIENIPPGWRARETYRFHGPDEIEEIFELAEAGKPFAVYSRTRLKRVK